MMAGRKNMKKPATTTGRARSRSPLRSVPGPSSMSYGEMTIPEWMFQLTEEREQQRERRQEEREMERERRQEEREAEREKRLEEREERMMNKFMEAIATNKNQVPMSGATPVEDHVRFAVEEAPEEDSGTNRSLPSINSTGATEPNASSSAVGSDIGTQLRTLISQAPPLPPRPSFECTEGPSNPMTFLENVERYAGLMRMNDQQKLGLAIECLKGKAKRWAKVHRERLLTFEEFRGRFLKFFWSERQQGNVKKQIENGKYDPEAQHSFSDHFNFYVEKAGMLTKPPAEEDLVQALMHHYPSGIQDLWYISGRRGISDTADFLENLEDHVQNKQEHVRRSDRIRDNGGRRFERRDKRPPHREHMHRDRRAIEPPTAVPQIVRSTTAALPPPPAPANNTDRRNDNNQQPWTRSQGNYNNNNRTRWNRFQNSQTTNNTANKNSNSGNENRVVNHKA